MADVQITVNGTTRSVPADCTVESLMEQLDVPPQGAAVALNHAVVPRSAWATTPVGEGAIIDLVTAMQGG